MCQNCVFLIIIPRVGTSLHKTKPNWILIHICEQSLVSWGSCRVLSQLDKCSAASAALNGQSETETSQPGGVTYIYSLSHSSWPIPYLDYPCNWLRSSMSGCDHYHFRLWTCKFLWQVMTFGFARWIQNFVKVRTFQCWGFSRSNYTYVWEKSTHYT